MTLSASDAPSLSIKSIIAVVIGNALEWYDFIVYSFLTIYIANAFFPSANPVNSLLAATATFGVAFCMRPVGGILFGIYADKYGRKRAITAIILLMFIAVFMLAATPTYAQIGMAAPLLIVLARLLQGLSAGGEFGTSTAMLIELSPPGQRGYYGSWQMVGQSLAMLLGASIGMLLTHLLSAQQISSWGLRIPFFIGLLIAPVGLYLRRHLDETHIDDALKHNESIQFGRKITEYFPQILIVMGLVVGGTVSTYTNLSYMPTYMTHYLHLSMSHAFTGLIIGLVIMLILMPIFGSLSDRIGRKPILVSSIFIYLLSVYPLFVWLHHEPTLIKLIIVQSAFCLLLSAYFGVFAVVIAELFPKEIRSTGLSISYNLAVMLFGGFAQFIVTELIEITATTLAIVYYLMTAILISLIAALFYKETRNANS